MTPLVLLLLLLFFFILALAFTAWAALTMADAARRAPTPEVRPRRAAAAERRSVTPKPWERVPPEGEKRGRQRRRDRAAKPAQRGPEVPPVSQAPETQRKLPVARNALWESQPDLTTKPARQPERQTVRRTARQSERQPERQPDEPGARAVVTPRKPNQDAFERFLENEKRRD